MEEELEKERKNIKIYLRKWTTIMIIILVASATICLQIDISGIFVYASHMMLAILLTVIGSMILYYKENKYMDRYKNYYVEKYMPAELECVVYDARAGISKQVIRQHNAIIIDLLYDSTDYISGIYKGVKFEQADVEAKVSQRGDSVVNIFYFYGRWMIFDFNKVLNHNLQIIHKGISAGDKTEEYEKIDVLDENWNKEFNIYSTNKTETLELLTSEFIGKLKKIQELSCAKICFVFHESKLHIGVDDHLNSFEMGKYEEDQEEIIKSSIENSMRLMKIVVEELNVGRVKW